MCKNQNHRIKLVGKDLWDHDVQPMTEHHFVNQTMALSSLTSMDGDSTTSMGSAFQCLITLAIKKFLLDEG